MRCLVFCDAPTGALSEALVRRLRLVLLPPPEYVLLANAACILNHSKVLPSKPETLGTSWRALSAFAAIVALRLTALAAKCATLCSGVIDANALVVALDVMLRFQRRQKKSKGMRETLRVSEQGRGVGVVKLCWCLLCCKASTLTNVLSMLS